VGRMRFGVHKALESEADALIMRELAKDPSFSSKSDILTPAKEALRRRREVYVSSGVPDASLRRGNIRRAFNPARPHLNSMEAIPMINITTGVRPDSDPTWMSRLFGE
jgi:hypothetical protein